MTISRLEFYLMAAIVLLVILAGGLFLHFEKSGAGAIGEWKATLEQQNDRIKAAEQAAKDAANKVPAVIKQEDSRSSDLARALAQIAEAKQQPVDIDALARRIREQMGVEAQLSGPSANLPNAPSAVTVPAKQLRDYMNDCDAATLEAGSCKLGLANKDKIIGLKDAQLTADKEEIAGLEAERDKAKQTVTKLQGGNAFVRTMKTGMIVGGSLAIGYGIHAATHR